MIYCVEDDSAIRELIIYTLNNTGFEAEGFEQASTLYEAINKKIPELILLDIMLPNESGIDILKKLRANINYKNIPVIIVSAKSGEFDKICGLDLGADDYITKPFGMMELISRIKAVLRRSADTDSCQLEFKNVVINTKKHTVFVDNEKIELTLKEFELLLTLIKNSGVVLTRDMLLGSIWGYDFDGETRTVDVHIRSLRQKLKSGADIIETVRGVGYKVV